MEAKKRTCDGCTACCDGRLGGNIYGRKFNHKNCHFNTGSGCAIYNDRPEDPCKLFKCEWLKDTNNFFPETMKPNLSGFLLTQRSMNDIPYLLAVTYTDPISMESLLWIMEMCSRKNINLAVKYNGEVYKSGTKEFMDNV